MKRTQRNNGKRGPKKKIRAVHGNRVGWKKVDGRWISLLFLLLLFSPALADTGGTITTILVNGTNYTVHTFSNSGTYNVTAGKTIEILLIGGGGGGGDGGPSGGGGGAGGFVQGNISVSATSYNVNVGLGGAGAAADQQGTSGTRSFINTSTLIYAEGGGGGAGTAVGTGKVGGGGGGGATTAVDNLGGAGNQTCFSGFECYGGNGGNSSGVGGTSTGGGGGGAGSGGGNASGGNGGNGGAGRNSSINGVNTCYGGGGGGAEYNTGNPGTATCGGGNGGNSPLGTPGANGVNGTGGGQGGHTDATGGIGGKGIVILRYPTTTTVNDTVITASLFNKVNGNTISGFCATLTGNGTQYICNSTGTTIQFVNVTGTLTIAYSNITAGTATPIYLNTTNASILISGSSSVISSTSQGLITLNATQLFTGTLIPSFNATNQLVTNMTNAGSLTLPVNNGTNPVLVAVNGNFSKNVTCTGVALQTVGCTATDIYDNQYVFNATDIWNEQAILNFNIKVTNGTLGGLLYDVNTTNGVVNVSLIRGYTYLVQFQAANATYEFANATLAANASQQRYEFEVLPAPSIDITILDIDTDALILQNMTISLTNNITGEIFYTVTGGYFATNLTVGEYTIKISNVNYSQSTYIVTINEGNVYFLTAYLQRNLSHEVIMQFVDSVSPTVTLPNVLVTQQRIVNGTWQSVSTKLTDITGRTIFGYVEDTAYRFIAIVNGYETKDFTLDPILFSTYTIKMQRTTSLDFEEDFQSVYVAYAPNIFYDAQQNQINITFNSPLGTFLSYNYTVTYPGGPALTGSGTNINGEMFSRNFNITGAGYLDKVNVTLAYDTSVGVPRSFTYSNLIIVAPGNTTFIANIDHTYGMGLLERIIIGTIIMIFLAGIVTLAAGPLWGLAIGLFIMGIWLKIGFWPWWASGISLLVGLVLIAARSD